VAARTLGASGFGSFTILVGILILAAALHGGWVGDARTVLDRHDPVIRGALAGYQLAFTTVGGVLAASAVWLTGLVDGRTAVLFGLLVVAWMHEDSGRRWFMARMTFWRIVVNDLVYLGATVAALVAIRVVGDGLTLEAFVTAMLVGAIAAIVDAVIALPAPELAGGPIQPAGLRTVAAFGAWRSAHEALRPLTTLTLRTIVTAIASAAALGRLEAARLTIAPVLLVINGAGSFLLPHYVSRARPAAGDGGDGGDGPARAMAVALVAGTVVYGTVVTAVAGSVTRLVAGSDLEAERLAVGGWCLFAVALAAGIPAGTALLAQRRSRLVFRVRCIDSALGLAAATALVAAVEPAAAPFGLALGAVTGAVLLWHQHRDVRAPVPSTYGDVPPETGGPRPPDAGGGEVHT
jgi:O-antigen/teichoic acid export membrane protein